MYSKIEITGRPISKKNTRIPLKNGMNIPSKAFRNFEKQALYQLLGIKDHYDGRCKVNYIFQMKGKLDSDCDNMIGGINDILQKAGIIADDKNITEGLFRKIAGNQNWKTVIEITDIFDT